MTFDSHRLARLEFIPAVEAIGGEATHFTPWLAEHIRELGHAIGVPLSPGDDELDLAELLRESTEVSVGQYSLDIRAHTPDDRIAAIENQYGWGDTNIWDRCSPTRLEWVPTS